MCGAHKHKLIGPSQTDNIACYHSNQRLHKVTLPDQHIASHVTRHCKMLFYTLFVEKEQDIIRHISEVAFSYL